VFAYASIFEISIRHVPKDDFPLPNIDLLVDKTIVKVCLLLFSDDSKFSSSASSR